MQRVRHNWVTELNWTEHAQKSGWTLFLSVSVKVCGRHWHLNWESEQNKNVEEGKIFSFSAWQRKLDTQLEPWHLSFPVSSSDYTTGSPGFPACKYQTMGLLSLHNHIYYYLIVNLFICTPDSSVSLEIWLTHYLIMRGPCALHVFSWTFSWDSQVYISFSKPLC